ncbi:formate dehydrogenase region TAT target [Methylobacterium sp. UNC378MF]|nr:formate dehydrogenase region TAT target [Methylobacterium sp. UNC378MF]
MMRQDPKTLGRRQFFRALGGSTVAAAAAVASPMAATEAQAYDPGEDETRSRYRLSDHVKAFYRTNGYETLLKNPDPAPGTK